MAFKTVIISLMAATLAAAAPAPQTVTVGGSGSVTITPGAGLPSLSVLGLTNADITARGLIGSELNCALGLVGGAAGSISGAATVSGTQACINYLAALSASNVCVAAGSSETKLCVASDGSFVAASSGSVSASCGSVVSAAQDILNNCAVSGLVAGVESEVNSVGVKVTVGGSASL